MNAKMNQQTNSQTQQKIRWGDNPEDPMNKVARFQDPTNQETQPPYQTNTEVTLLQHKTTKKADPQVISDHQPTITTRQKIPHKFEERHPSQPSTTATMEQG